MKAPSRQNRQPTGNRRLTSRDLAALSFVAKAQPVRRSAVQARLEVSAAVSYRLLRKLRDFGVVKVWVDALETENRYTLTALGAHMLAERFDQEHRVLRGIGRPSAHHDMSVELFVALTLACKRLGWLELAEFHFERDIRRRIGNPRGALVPDAAALLQTRRGETLGLAVEADTGSEKNPSWVAERKGRAYGQLYDRGAPLLGTASWRVACVVPTKRRLHRLIKAMYEADVPEGLWYFALRTDMLASCVLRPESWKTLRTSASGEAVHLIAESPLQAVQSDCSIGLNGVKQALGSDSDALHENEPGVSRPGEVR